MQCPGDGNCSNQGICDFSTGTCTCNSGFQGYICQGKNFLLLHSLANIHMMKYIYFSSTDMQCPGDGSCSNQGTCDVSTGICVCNLGFEGDMCEGNVYVSLANKFKIP